VEAPALRYRPELVPKTSQGWDAGPATTIERFLTRDLRWPSAASSSVLGRSNSSSLSGPSGPGSDARGPE
jgi:hypothetical protein